MKKFNFRKVLDGLTASSPGSGSGSGSNSSGGAGSGSVHPGGTAGVLREEIQETLTSEYFHICKVSFELAYYCLFYCCEERSIQNKTLGLEIVEMPALESLVQRTLHRSVCIKKDVPDVNLNGNVSLRGK